jgi:hypothetical protein
MSTLCVWHTCQHSSFGHWFGLLFVGGVVAYKTSRLHCQSCRVSTFGAQGPRLLRLRLSTKTTGGQIDRVTSMNNPMDCYSRVAFPKAMRAQNAFKLRSTLALLLLPPRCHWCLASLRRCKVKHTNLTLHDVSPIRIVSPFRDAKMSTSFTRAPQCTPSFAPFRELENVNQDHSRQGAMSKVVIRQFVRAVPRRKNVNSLTVPRCKNII